MYLTTLAALGDGVQELCGASSAPTARLVSESNTLATTNVKGASGQFHILTGVVPKEGGACESL